MENKRISFDLKDFEDEAYKKYFHQNQEEYIRIRLRSVKLYHEGKTFHEIAKTLTIHHQTVRKYVNRYILGGFSKLCERDKRPHKTLLNESQCIAFKEILLNKRPNEVGLSGNIWTGKIMCEYLKNTYNVVYKSGIYDLLERLNLSHQKAHADYGNADPIQQKEFLEDFKNALLAADSQTSIIQFDEFSVCQTPSSFYGWAEKNTRPKCTTNEKKKKGLMDF